MDENKKEPIWKLVVHNYQIADTGDYDGYYEISDGKLSIYSKDDEDEPLQEVVNALNNGDCTLFIDNSAEFELELAKKEIERLKFMIDKGLGWKDMENDIPDLPF